MGIENAVGIKERLLSERQFLVLILLQNEGEIPVPGKAKTHVTLRRGKAYVFQVQSICRVLKHEPYRLRDSDGNLVSALEPGGGLDFQYLYGADKYDLLRNENTDWLIYHMSIAVQQPEIRIYPQIPPAELLGGWEYLVANEPNPQAGSNYGYVAGKDMEDYFNPPAALETIGWMKKEGERSYNKYGFYNESKEKDIVPVFNVLGRGYMVHPVMDEASKRKIVAGPPYGPPRTLVSLGPVRSLFSLDTPAEWDEAKCYINIEQAMLAENMAKTGASRQDQAAGVKR